MCCAAALRSSYRCSLETGLRAGLRDVLRPAAYHNPAQQRLIEAGHASLWVASHEGRELAHTLVHHSGDRAILFEAGEADSATWQHAAEPTDAPAAPRFAANFLLQWTIIRWAAEAGFATYDMSGVDNHEAPGPAARTRRIPCGACSASSPSGAPSRSSSWVPRSTRPGRSWALRRLVRDRPVGRPRTGLRGR